MGKPWEIIHGDVRRVCKTLDPDSFDACLCDPPYELSNDGQASAAGVALEFMFPKYPQFESHFFGRDQLTLLIGEVLELGRGGGVPGPSPTVPVGSVTLDDDAALRDDDVEDAGEGAITAAEWKARQHREAKGTKHLGDFALKLADTGAMLETLNRVGTCFYSDASGDDGMGVWVGAHVRATSLPGLLHNRAPIDLGDALVRACDDPLTGPVGTRRGAEGQPVADPLSLRRCDEDLLSACAALALFGALQLGGAQLVRARSGAGRFPTKLQSRRIRVVDTRTHRALTFNLLLHSRDVSSTGFMGKSWDGSKVAYDVALWQQVLRVLKPGAPLLAFGGTRTYHRMVVAIEDAGFEIRDQLAWMYGCLSEDTELLVDGRWCHFSEAAEGRRAMAFDPETGGFAWLPIDGVYTYEVDDVAFNIRSEFTDQLVSRNHRCLVEEQGRYVFRYAEEVARQREARVPVLQNVRGLLAALPLPQPQSSDTQPHMRQGRSLPLHLLEQNTTDGAPPHRRDHFGSCAVTHRGGASREPQSNGQRDRESLALQLEPRSQVVRGARFTRADLARIEPVHYRGLIWCICVATGAFVARRNGKVFVTGNSGFPKSLDVSKAIDKAAGAVREVTGTAGRLWEQWEKNAGGGEGRPRSGERRDIPVTPSAQEWQGYGTALKPAHEPIVLARKPLDGTVAENVTRWGVGGLAIDACRINWEGAPSGWSKTGSKASENVAMSGGNYGRDPKPDAEGRWPANVILDEEAGAILDAQSGSLRARGNVAPTRRRQSAGVTGWGVGRDGPVDGGDSGGASRFFYTAKADTYQRNAGLESVPKRTRAQNTERKEGSVGSQHARAGAGSKDGSSNHHPTIKPIDLIRYFARLILPPPRSTPRRILVPFSGSGSEIIGCLQAGWDEVVGIERESEYVEIARQRITNGGVLSALADRKMRKRKKKRAP